MLPGLASRSRRGRRVATGRRQRQLALAAATAAAVATAVQLALPLRLTGWARLMKRKQNPAQGEALPDCGTCRSCVGCCESALEFTHARLHLAGNWTAMTWPHLRKSKATSQDQQRTAPLGQVGTRDPHLRRVRSQVAAWLAQRQAARVHDPASHTHDSDGSCECLPPVRFVYVTMHTRMP